MVVGGENGTEPASNSKMHLDTLLCYVFSSYRARLRLSQRGICPQNVPADIGAQVFAAHQAASGLFDSGTAFGGDTCKAIDPLANGTRRNAKFASQLDLAIGLGIGFKVHGRAL